MTQTKTNNQANPSQQRTVLLAVDLKNSVLAEVDAGNTNPIAYSPYGHQSAQLEVMSQLGFNGERRETMSERYFLGNGYRVYNPRLMRFHSPDSMSPFGKGGLNAYMYCGGEPVMNSDPTGHLLFRVIAAAVTAAAVQSLDDRIPLSTRLTTGQSANRAVTTTNQRIKNLISTRVGRVAADVPSSEPRTAPKEQGQLNLRSDRQSSFGSGSSSGNAGGYANRTDVTRSQSTQSHGYANRTEVKRSEPPPPRITGTTGANKEIRGNR